MSALQSVALAPPPLDLLRGAALFLDFDGTLVEIAARPEAVSVDAALAALMRRLSQRMDGRLAIISGRPIAQIRALFGRIDFAVGGSHGLEVEFADGRRLAPPRPESLDGARAALAAFAETAPGVLLEDKPFGAALHFREAPEAEAACLALARRLADETDLHLQLGKMMVELRPQGADKGDALKALLAAPEMAGARPVFLGDDVTDEHGFAAADAAGGSGVLVGPERASAARWRLADVGAVRAWLEAASASAAASGAPHNV